MINNHHSCNSGVLSNENLQFHNYDCQLNLGAERSSERIIPHILLIYVTAVVLSQYPLINLRLSSRMNTSKANRTAKSAQDSLCAYSFPIGTN